MAIYMSDYKPSWAAVLFTLIALAYAVMAAASFVQARRERKNLRP